MCPASELVPNQVPWTENTSNILPCLQALAIHVIQLVYYRDSLIPMEAKVREAFQACTLMSSSFGATTSEGLQIHQNIPTS